MEQYIGIDIGTSSAKLTLINRRRRDQKRKQQRV